MFLVIRGEVVALGGTWNTAEQGTTIIRHLDALEEISTDHVFVDLSEFRFLLGDVNLDGSVNSSDISPFIAHLSAGTFSDEADIDRNGVVNFLDISPFIVLLSAQ